jgi:hypothetical protein
LLSQYPNPHQAYHPNEMTADVLASWIGGGGQAPLDHPVSRTIVKWAQERLR